MGVLFSFIFSSSPEMGSGSEPRFSRTAYQGEQMPIPKVLFSFWQSLPGSPESETLFVEAPEPSRILRSRAQERASELTGG